MLNFEQLEYDTEDSNVLCRIIERNLDLVVTYLATDGRSMDENVLYEIELMDDQWFVIVNYPLLEAEVETIIINHPDRYSDNSKLDPILHLLHSSVCEISRQCRERYGDERQ